MVYYGLGLNVGNLDGDIYINFAINVSMEAAAYVLCLVLLGRIGRKPLHAGTMILGGVACLCTIFTVLYGNECKSKQRKRFCPGITFSGCDVDYCHGYGLNRRKVSITTLRRQTVSI